MFRIGAVDPNSGVKIHFASNESIANEVMDELESRFGAMKMDTIDSNECVWDPGGMMLVDDKMHSFLLSENITVMCLAQHCDFLASHIHSYDDKPLHGTNTQYVKFHGRYFCICMTPEEFHNLCILVKFVDEDEIAESKAKREAKIDELVESGHVVRAIKDADGKVKIASPSPPYNIPPEKLN